MKTRDELLQKENNVQSYKTFLNLSSTPILFHLGSDFIGLSVVGV